MFPPTTDRRLLRFFYNLLFPAAFVLLLPGYLRRMFRRGNYRRHFGQRFGRYAPEVARRLSERRGGVWLQAVSVGEMLVALKLLAELRALSPRLPIVVSTTTTTGYALAEERVPSDVEVIYNPVDLQGAVSRAFEAVQPATLVIVDGGLWPNQLWEAQRRNVPSALVNARLSPRSERRFRMFPRLASALYGLLDLVCVTEQPDLQRWQSLGISPEKLHFTGSVKFDDATAIPTNDSNDVKRALLQSLHVSQDAPILLGGSTHLGEELVLAKTFQHLSLRFSSLFLVIVPRHAERATQIRRELESIHLKVALRSHLPETNASSERPDVLLIDTTGELRDWYPLATLVFMGKSLCAIGGQNPAEAIAAGVPVIFGPRMENFADLTAQLLACKAAVQVNSSETLTTRCEELLSDPTERQRLATTAREVLSRHRGATARTARLLLEQLQNSACQG